MKNIPYKRVKSTDKLEQSYMNKGPNRETRKAELKNDSARHNNRATTKARKTQRVELKTAVSTRNSLGKKIIELVPTGIIRSIRQIRKFKWGGNTR